MGVFVDGHTRVQFFDTFVPNHSQERGSFQMRTIQKTLPVLSVAIVLLFPFTSLSLAQVDSRWKPNDPGRPVPPVITPGTASTQDVPGRPPSDAVVLFDGKDLSQWAGE